MRFLSFARIFDLNIFRTILVTDLNIFRTILVTDLQNNYVERHTRNSLFSNKSAANYKENVFPDGDFLYTTIKYGAQFISCTSIKPNIMIRTMCVLGFCDECPE